MQSERASAELSDRNQKPATTENSVDTLLSPRECEIARLVAVGYPNKTIGGILDISPWTVATHIRRIFMKLGVHGRAPMVICLAQRGFHFQRPGGAEYRGPATAPKKGIGSIAMGIKQSRATQSR